MYFYRTTGFYWIMLIVILCINLYGAYLMSKAAADKGYGPEAHIMALCFWLGIFGYLYALSLPDKNLQNYCKSIEELTRILSMTPEAAERMQIEEALKF